MRRSIIVLLGASLGLVFIPCGGPILAALTSNVARDRVGGWLVVTALAYAAGRAMQALLAGVKPGDPVTFLTAAALCVLMTLMGSLLPAVRAV